jgi:hypothetical protein
MLLRLAWNADVVGANADEVDDAESWDHISATQVLILQHLVIFERRDKA